MNLQITSYSRIYQGRVMANGRLLFYQENIVNFADFIKTAFRQEQVVYPKFFKMDNLSKLGFLAAELSLREKPPAVYAPEEIGVVFANASASLDTDMAHQETIRERSSYFPSPSVFVYTLPNIVIGEVCIRHKFKGENAFLVSEHFDAALIADYAANLFETGRVKACLTGWIELMGDRAEALTAWVEAVDPPAPSAVNRPLTFNAGALELLMKPN